MSFGLFSTLVTALVSVGHVYLYRRLLRDTGAPRWVRRLGGALLVLLGPGFILVRQLFWPLPFPWGGRFSAAQWLWSVSALYLVALLAAVDLARRVRRARATPVSLERRQLVAAAASAATASLVGYGSWRACGPAPEVREVVVRLAGLPRALDGFTLVQLSDLHIGSLLERRFVEEVVGRVNALRPDLVAITGDLVDGSPSQLGHAVGALGALRSRHGTYFVTGNHEYHSDDRAWCAALEGLGLTVLRNRAVPVGEGAHAFDLVGVDDWSGGRRRGRPGYDLERALAGLRPGRARVLLAHQPANFPAAVEQGVGLQLSGHTHGGQVFPMTAMIHLHWDWVAGLYAHGAGQIYVSRGTGFWGPPLRIASPPEITRLVLAA